MPNAVVKSYAEKSGKSVEEVEKMWDEVKSSVFSSDNYEDLSDERKYSIVNGIVKKNLGINEEENQLISRFKAILEAKKRTEVEEEKEDDEDLEDDGDADDDGKDDEEERLGSMHFQESIMSDETVICEGNSLKKLAKDRGLKYKGYGYYTNASGKTFKANKTKTDFVEVKGKVGDKHGEKKSGKDEGRNLKNHKQLLKSFLKRKAEREGKVVSDEEIENRATALLKHDEVRLVGGKIKVSNKKKSKVSKVHVKKDGEKKTFATMKEANEFVRWLPSQTLVEFEVFWENTTKHDGQLVSDGIKISPLTDHIKDFYSTYTNEENKVAHEYSKYMVGEKIYKFMSRFLDKHEIGEEDNIFLKSE